MLQKVTSLIVLAALAFSAAPAYAVDLSVTAIDGEGRVDIVSDPFENQDLDVYMTHSVHVYHPSNGDAPLGEFSALGVQNLFTYFAPMSGTWTFVLGGPWSPETTAQQDCALSYSTCLADGYVIATTTYEADPFDLWITPQNEEGYVVVASKTYEPETHEIYLLNSETSADVPLGPLSPGAHSLWSEFGDLGGTWTAYLAGPWATSTDQTACAASYSACQALGLVVATSTHTYGPWN